MDKKIDIVTKEAPGKIVASKRRMTPLQLIVVGLLMATLLFISIGSMVTYGSDRQPSENIFLNSQTMHVLSA